MYMHPTTSIFFRLQFIHHNITIKRTKIEFSCISDLKIKYFGKKYYCGTEVYLTAGSTYVHQTTWFITTPFHSIRILEILLTSCFIWNDCGTIYFYWYYLWNLNHQLHSLKFAIIKYDRIIKKNLPQSNIFVQYVLFEVCLFEDIIVFDSILRYYILYDVWLYVGIFLYIIIMYLYVQNYLWNQFRIENNNFYICTHPNSITKHANYEWYSNTKKSWNHWWHSMNMIQRNHWWLSKINFRIEHLVRFQVV